MSSACGTGCQTLTAAVSIVMDVTPGTTLELDTQTFGEILTDGFESGDTSAWSSSNIDTAIYTTSPGPNVRFTIVPEPSGWGPGLVAIATLGALLQRRKSSQPCSTGF